MAHRERRSQNRRLSQLAGFNSTKQTETVLTQLEKRLSNKQNSNDRTGKNVDTEFHMLSTASSADVDEATERASPESQVSGELGDLSQLERTTETTTAVPITTEIPDGDGMRRESNSRFEDSLGAKKQSADDTSASDLKPQNAGDAAAEDAMSAGHISMSQVAVTLQGSRRVAERRKQRQTIRPSHHTFRKSVRIVSEEAKERKANEQECEAKDAEDAQKLEHDEVDEGKHDGEVQDTFSWLGFSNMMGTDAAPNREFEEYDEEDSLQESTWFSNLGRRVSGLVGVAALSTSDLQQEVCWEDERDRMLGLQTKNEIEREKQLAAEQKEEDLQAVADAMKKIQEDISASVHKELEEREENLLRMEELEEGLQQKRKDNEELRRQIEQERATLQRVRETRIEEQTLLTLQEFADGEESMGDAGKAELQRQIAQQRAVVERKQQEYERELIAEREKEEAERAKKEAEAEMLMLSNEYKLELQMRDSELLMYSTAVLDREGLLRASRRVRRHTWDSKWALMASQDQDESEQRSWKAQNMMARLHAFQPLLLGCHQARLARCVQAAQDAHSTECWRLREILLYRRQHLLTSADSEAAEAAWERAMWSLRHKLEAALRSIAELQHFTMGLLSEPSAKERHGTPSERTKVAIRQNELLNLENISRTKVAMRQHQLANLTGTESKDELLQIEAEGAPSTPAFGATGQHETDTPFYQRKDILAQAYLRKLEAEIPPNYSFARPQFGVPSALAYSPPSSSFSKKSSASDS